MSGSTLNLGNKGLVDADAEVLAKALKVNESLTTIDLQCNGIGPDGAKALAEAKREGLQIYQ